MQLVLTDGAFKRLCDTARNDPKNNYVMLIDEFNRGNIPKIFGELITVIEKDKRGRTVQLAQSGANFSVPENVLIIGTMNTADRSIHLLDTALRRRFQFIEILPDSDLLEGRAAGALALDTFLDGLNNAIRKRFGRDKQVGHSLFFENGQIITTAEAFASVFHNELLPLLQEYLYEDYRALEQLLGAVIDVEAERTAELANDPEVLCAELARRFGSASA
jgi:5-methylcytosine-specific restriction enzyme B